MTEVATSFVSRRHMEQEIAEIESNVERLIFHSDGVKVFVDDSRSRDLEGKVPAYGDTVTALYRGSYANG